MPVDIPTLEILGRAPSRAGSVNPAAKIDKLAVAQVRRKLMSGFSPTSCDGTVVVYRDFYGSPVEAGWCDGIPFPQYMTNPRFVAITQTLSLE
jgi:hypothetical protein